jgi:hypothetical protein
VKGQNCSLIVRLKWSRRHFLFPKIHQLAFGIELRRGNEYGLQTTSLLTRTNDFRRGSFTSLSRVRDRLQHREEKRRGSVGKFASCPTVFFSLKESFYPPQSTLMSSVDLFLIFTAINQRFRDCLLTNSVSNVT